MADDPNVENQPEEQIGKTSDEDLVGGADEEGEDVEDIGGESEQKGVEEE